MIGNKKDDLESDPYKSPWNESKNSEDAVELYNIKGPRLGFGLLFLTVGVVHCGVAIIAIRDGYFPSEELLERFRYSSDLWFWISNRFVMPLMAFSAALEFYLMYSVLKKNLDKKVYRLGMLGILLSWFPLNLFLILPLCLWMRKRSPKYER